MDDDREMWALPGGTVIYNVHPADVCEGRGCPMHHPSEHHMSDWPLMWSNLRGQMYRVCPHGRQHPDPDDMAWRRQNGFYTTIDEAIWRDHSCPCGCCHPAMAVPGTWMCPGCNDFFPPDDEFNLPPLCRDCGGYAG